MHLHKKIKIVLFFLGVELFIFFHDNRTKILFFSKYTKKEIKLFKRKFFKQKIHDILFYLQSKLNCEVLHDELAFEVRWAVAGESIVIQLVAKLGEFARVNLNKCKFKLRQSL